MNPVRQLREHGQAPWIDYISGGDDYEDDLCRLLGEDRTGLAALSEALDG